LSERLAFSENKGNIKKMIIPMESIKKPKELLRNSLKMLIKQLLKLQK